MNYPMRKVWQQDDAIPDSHEDYESEWKAYKRLSGQNFTQQDAEETLDRGDEIRYLMPDGWVVVSSACGNSCVYAF